MAARDSAMIQVSKVATSRSLAKHTLVIGVLDPKFEFPHRNLQFSEPADLWIPLALSEEEVTNWSGSWELNVIARLKETVTLDEARQELAATAVRFEESNRGYRGPGGIDAGWRIYNGSGQRRSLRAEPPLTLCPACDSRSCSRACVRHVANLLLARSTARSREMAVR